VVYGATIILIMLLAPEGVFWSVRDRWLTRRRPTVPSAPPHSATATATATALPARCAITGGVLLDVRGLGKRFGGLHAVSDVSFTLNAGTILGIIGPNGAGKTTLFNVLNGVLSATSGEALLDGKRLTGRKLHQVCRLGVGRTFQVVRSFPRLSLLDNVLAGAYGAGLPNRAAQAAADAALEIVGLTALAGHPAGGLTNKELRLMELARAVASQPRLLLLDETLAGLGHDECGDVLAVLDRLRATGMTIIIIEHTMHAMMRIADEFLVIDHGRVLARGLPGDVVENRAVIEAYLGKKWLAKCST
jgi:ABC-type branched-subunit amino acid transport system ATPase component